MSASGPGPVRPLISATGVSAPVEELKANVPRSFVSRCDTRTNLPAGSKATSNGDSSVATGAPTAVRAPVVPSIEKTLAVLSAALATIRNLPLGSIAAAPAPCPAMKGDPLTADNAPLVPLMGNAETLLEVLFFTWRNCPEGSTTPPMAPVPVG